MNFNQNEANIITSFTHFLISCFKKSIKSHWLKVDDTNGPISMREIRKFLKKNFSHSMSRVSMVRTQADHPMRSWFKRIYNNNNNNNNNL